jgi:hypothetical protein
MKSFIDNETQIGYNTGSTYESSDSERVAYLQSEGFLHGKPKKDKAAKESKESNEKKEKIPDEGEKKDEKDGK